MLSRSVYLLLAGLALTLLASGCGGASPETRAMETLTVLQGTSTPNPLQVGRISIAQETVTETDPEIAAILTAEASLSIATPAAADEATPAVEQENR